MKKLLACSAVLLMLAACGGGGGSAEPPVAETNEVPAAALASTSALVDWSGTLAASETKDPLSIEKAQLPTSETEEPRSL